MKNKKAMSSVIATVLIISITIAIIGIVFAFIVPFVQDSMKKSESCFNANQAVYIKSVCHSTNDGKINNESLWIPTGRLSGAYQFNGINQSIKTQNKPELNFGTNDFTLEAWVNAESNNDLGIVSKWNGSGNYNQAYWLAIYQKKISFGLYNLSDINAYNIVQSTENISINRWYHVLAERKKIDDTYANISIYIDGKLNSSLVIPLFSINNEETLKIGVDSFHNPWYFNGIIDEIKIYNRALTPTEILQNYNNDGNDYVKEGIVSYWDFNQKEIDKVTKDNGNIQVRIARGSEKIQLSKLLFILKNSGGTLTYKISSNINQYEEKQYQLAGLIDITSVQIASIISDGIKEITCEPNPSFTNIADC